MKVKQIKADQREQWNNLVAKEPSFGLLQSWEWGAFKEQAGWKVFRVAVQDKERVIAGAQLLIKSAPLGIASMAYVPRGPVGDWMTAPVNSLLLDELHRIGRKHRAIFLTMLAKGGQEWAGLWNMELARKSELEFCTSSTIPV